VARNGQLPARELLLVDVPGEVPVHPFQPGLVETDFGRVHLGLQSAHTSKPPDR
jgi:hypothetical protein